MCLGGFWTGMRKGNTMKPPLKLYFTKTIMGLKVKHVVLIEQSTPAAHSPVVDVEKSNHKKMGWSQR